MGNKLILLLTSVLMPYILCCQEKKLVESQVFYDKTNQLPVFRISKQGEKIEVDYYTALDTINSISINVGFIGVLNDYINIVIAFIMLTLARKITMK